MSKNDPTGQFRSRTIGTDYNPTEKRIERLESQVRELEQRNWELEQELGWLKTYSRR